MCISNSGESAKTKVFAFSYLCAKLNSKRTKPATAHTLDRCTTPIFRARTQKSIKKQPL